MVTQRRWLSALLTLLSVANATLTQELRDRKLPDCSSDIVYSDIEDKGTFWYNTGAEQFANDYINSNTDHTMWAQNLFRELLGNRDYSNFDCRTTGATCDTPGDMCDQLNAVNKGGLFYLFVSLRNFHTNMASFEKDVNNNFLKSAVSVSQIQEILNIPDGTSDESPDLLSIFGSAVGIAGGAAGLASGPFGATAGAVSGIFSILSTFNSGSVAPDNTLKSAAKIDKMVEDTITKTNDIISQLVGAVFGRPGQPQDIIPENMRHGGVDNPAVQVFGWGSWLKEHSNTVEAEQFAKKFQEKTSQSLLWQMGRLYKKMFVVLRTDVQKDKCIEPNNAWDDEKSRCMDLLNWNGADDSTLGGGNDLIANKMWQSWNMDPYWTMKNAVTCWEEHDGHIGDVEPTQVWESDVPPPCFFAMEVVSGSYYVRGKGMIELGGDFAGQHGLDGMLWPKSKCEENSKYWEISDHCEYSWVGDE